MHFSNAKPHCGHSQLQINLPSQIYVNVSIYTVKEYKDAHASLWALSMSCKPNLTSWLQGTLPWAHPFQLCQAPSADRTQLLTKVPGANTPCHKWCSCQPHGICTMANIGKAWQGNSTVALIQSQALWLLPSDPCPPWLSTSKVGVGIWVALQLRAPSMNRA